ncbi:amino acid adenylation domain-containing protein [Pseudomonas sp. SC11]|uniref:non-ribosomal peptide synthetase n=1 Tax=Pseudomonas sp. SC11 TaxID=326927 RepID=UPI00399968F6
MLDRLMQGCWLRGIRLSARAGEVVVDHAPPGALDESTAQALRSHGADVVRWLDAHPAYFRDRALTDNEQALWFLHRLEPQSCAYNIAYAARLKPSLLDEDLVPRLQRAWHDVQQRHPLLCSPFAERDGVPVQRGAPTQWLGLRQVELQAADPKALHQRLTDLADEPFDLASGDVSRLTLVCNRHAEGCDYILLLGIHHIAADGATIYQIIVDELISHLASQPLAPVDAQAYRDFGSALYRRSEAEQASELAWWQARLQDAPALVLPTDFVTSDTPAHVGGDTSARFDETDTARIRALARSIGVTPYVLLLSLFQQYLGVLSGQTDFVLGTPAGWRLRREHLRMPGYLVNPLALRCTLQPTLSSIDWARCVEREVKETLQHRHYPFARLRQQLALPREHGRALFQHMFTLNKDRSMPYEVHVERLFAEQRGAAHALNLVINDEDRHFHCRWRFSKALYRQDTVDRLRDQFIGLVQAVLERPDVPFADLDWLAPHEQAQLQGETCAPVFDNAWQAFVEQTVQRPAAVALEDLHGCLDYATLGRQVAVLAAHLQGQGAPLPGQRIALCLPRSRALVLHMLAAWQSGATFVVVDPAWPASRQQAICEDAQPCLWIGQAARPEWLPAAIAWLEPTSLKDAPTIGLRPQLAPETPAYVVYTSGSSGRPKGVIVSHGNLIHYVSACLARLDLPVDASLASLASCATDLGHTALFGALLSGRRLRLLDESLAFDAEGLADTLQDQPVDLLKIVPSHLNALLVASQPQRVLPRLCLMCGGDALGAELIARVRELRPALRIVNHYGPSETTIGVLTHEVDSAGTAALGRPLANVQVSVRDPAGRLLPIGVAGELCIQGPTVALGYVHASEADRARFTAHGYRTGDRVKINTAGRVEFFGRLDEQVKIRGYRVEPGEVAEQLRALPGVHDAQVLNAPVALTGNRLVAFLISDSDDLQPIQARLQALLPDYMQPAQWHRVERFERLANGKVDRQALLRRVDQVPLAEAQPQADAAPSNALEAQLLEIWRTLLGKPTLGVDDNFFQHGGDSILGLQIIALARQQQITLTPKQLFAEPTVRQLARVARTPRSETEQCLLAIAQEILGKPALQLDDNFFAVGGDSILSLQIIAKAKQAGLTLKPKQIFEYPSVRGWAEVAVRKDTPAASAADAVEPKTTFALTPIQRWFFEQEQQTPGHWDQSILLAVQQPLDTERLAAALARLVERHASLRLVFERDATGWAQRYQPATPDLQVLHLETRPLDDDLLAHWQGGWSLDQAPMIRWVYFTHDQQLLCNAHHLLIDSVSWQVLMEELEQLYLRPEQALPPVSAGFHRWSEALAQHAAEPRVQAQAEYWRRQLTDSVVNAAGDNHYGDSRTLEVRLSAEHTDRLLGEANSAYATQTQDLLVAALGRVIARWLGREQVTLELESHGRSAWDDSPELSRSVGWHTSRYPLAIKASDDPASAIVQAKEALREVPEQGIGYGLLRADPAHGLGAADLLTFNYLGRADQWFAQSQLWQLARPLCPGMRAASTARTHWLDVTALVEQGQLHLEWRYAPQRHSTAQVSELARQMVQTLEALLEHCQGPSAGRATASDFADSGLSDDEFLALLEQLEQ